MPGIAATAASSVRFVGKPLLLFDTLMVFPPFHAFNARRVFERHRGRWAGLAVIGALS